MEQQAILVSHGAPSDPQTQERAIQALAVRVRFWAPDWQVSGTTLAAKGELEATLTSLPDAVIYPFFMAEGYFTRIALPKRLKALGRNHAFQHKAFGHAPELPSLMVKTALRAAETAGYAPKDTQLLLAAHGSQVTRASYEQTEAVASKLRALTPFKSVVTGYIEEEPKLSQSAKNLGQALCLPFFALRASHVLKDVPEALCEAGFEGALLPAIGEVADVARLIAQTLKKSPIA